MGNENGETSLEQRTRRSTIERFNDEMAVLDRPLENEAEYYEEPPPRKRRRLGMVAGAALVLGAGAFLAWSHVSGTVNAAPPLVVASALSVAEPASAPAVTASPVTPVHAPIVVPAPAPAPPVALATPTPEEPPPAMPRAASRTAWSKVGRATGHEDQHHHRGRVTKR
jgi:hypothetical protein